MAPKLGALHLDQQLLQAVNCDTRALVAKLLEIDIFHFPFIDWVGSRQPIRNHGFNGLTCMKYYKQMIRFSLSDLLSASKDCKIFEARSVIWNLQTLASLISRMVLLTYRPAMHLAQVQYNQYTAPRLHITHLKREAQPLCS